MSYERNAVKIMHMHVAGAAHGGRTGRSNYKCFGIPPDIATVYHVIRNAFWSTLIERVYPKKFKIKEV